MTTFSKADAAILRGLGKQVAEVAALPRQAETVRLWKALNGLKPERPMVMIDQIPFRRTALWVICATTNCRPRLIWKRSRCLCFGTMRLPRRNGLPR